MFIIHRAFPVVRDLYDRLGGVATFGVRRHPSAPQRGVAAYFKLPTAAQLPDDIHRHAQRSCRRLRSAKWAIGLSLCRLSAVVALPLLAMPVLASAAPTETAPAAAMAHKPVTAMTPTLLQRPLTDIDQAPHWLTAQLRWQASPAQAFIVRVEPNAAYFAASSHWTSAMLDAQAFDLRIYHANPAQPNQIGDLALEVPHTGHAMTMYHTGQADAPLLVITQTNGRLYNIYGFHLGQNAQGQPQVINSLQRTSDANPEIVIHRQRGLFLLIKEPMESNITITRVRYENGQWHTLSPSTAGYNRLRKLAPQTED